MIETFVFFLLRALSSSSWGCPGSIRTFSPTVRGTPSLPTQGKRRKVPTSS